MNKKFVRLEATYLGLEKELFKIEFEVEEKMWMYQYYMDLERYLYENNPELLEQIDVEDFQIVIWQGAKYEI